MGTYTEQDLRFHISKLEDPRIERNKPNLLENIAGFFETELERNFRNAPHQYKRTVDKDHSRLEIREYWHTDNVSWMSERDAWKGLASVGESKTPFTGCSMSPWEKMRVASEKTFQWRTLRYCGGPPSICLGPKGPFPIRACPRKCYGRRATMRFSPMSCLDSPILHQSG
jgi:hypothetical protein